MKTLKPIYDHDSYSAPIAKEIYYALYAAIFAPLFQIMEGDKTVENAKVISKQEGYATLEHKGKMYDLERRDTNDWDIRVTTKEGRQYKIASVNSYQEAFKFVNLQNATPRYLVQALRSGKLQYVNGFFIGPLNSNLSKELRGIGAVYNKVKKAYKLETGNLPQDVLLAITEGNIEAKAKLRKVEDFLKAVEGQKIKVGDLEPFFGKTLQGLDRQFDTTTKKVTGKVLGIPLRPELVEKLKDDYTENLDLYIQKWHDEQILRLRQKVSQNVQQGFRAENLIQDIQAEKKVSYNKAKFLAKQETSLMVSKYRQVRYEDAGVNQYMWSTSKDQRVRDAHRHLQGKIFRFDQPPVTDPATGARNNPGEDYNCRCVAIPVLSTANMLELDYAK